MAGSPEPAGWVAPMLAQSLRYPDEAGPLRTGDWVYERKLDGLRCIAIRNGSQVELWSRNRLSFNRRFPSLVQAVGSLPADSFVLDGELVAFQGGETSFQLLQSGAPPVLVAFDLVHLLGRSTAGLALTERADLLGLALPGRDEDGATIRISEHLVGEPGELMVRACTEGWEGIVAKRAASPYRSGRSPDWRKMKCTARQELVVGGWTDPSGARTGFGALLVGYYDGTDLRYAGKVGTGFDKVTLRSLHNRLRDLAEPAPPFADPPRDRTAHWVRPELVAEIAFTEWTRDGRMRHPSFLGLRPDKDPRDVVRETPA